MLYDMNTDIHIYISINVIDLHAIPFFFNDLHQSADFRCCQKTGRAVRRNASKQPENTRIPSITELSMRDQTGRRRVEY